MNAIQTSHPSIIKNPALLQNKPHLRRLILFGTPLLTGILLLFHPLPDQTEMRPLDQLEGLELYSLLAPIADQFLIVHLLFALALAMLGLTVFLLLDGVRGLAATLSRIYAFVFAVSYIMYETIIGTVTALLIRGAAALSPDEQAAVGAAVYRNFVDPFLGDLPSVLAIIAWLSWLLTVTSAAFALRRSGKPLGPCILLGLSFVFISHASLLGPIGMLLFLLAVVGIERAGSDHISLALNKTHVQQTSPAILDVVEAVRTDEPLGFRPNLPLILG
jgi:hypothetical protein